MRVSSKSLKRYRWEGEGAYRVLSYYFTLRWNSVPLGEYVTHVLEPFAVPPDPAEQRDLPTPGLPPQYSLLTMARTAKRRYRLFYGVESLLKSDEPRDVLEHLFWHINSETSRTTGSFLLIHAGAVVSPGGDGILLPGDSGAGKSTLVTALVRAGFGYLSDEAGAIDPVTGRLYPYPRAICLKKDREGRFELFPDLQPSQNGWPTLTRQWWLRAEEIRPDALAGPCEVRLIVAPRYREGAPTEIVPMTPGEAVVELASYSLNLGRYGSRALPLLANLARGARAYRLTSGDLGEALRAVEGLVSRAPAAP